MAIVAQAVPSTLNVTVTRLALAAALGMFLGLEREWSQKSAGIRTFALISLLGAVFTVLGRESLLVVGAALVVVQGTVLALEGLLSTERGLSLTTSVSMLVAYGVGALVASDHIVEGVSVAVLSSLLLVLKRELHSFAWGLTHEELQSATEFAILAFVIFPLLPAREVSVGAAGISVALEPRVVWLMVVTVAGIGIVNYAIVQTYGGRGIAVTGFFGGLASSTAVVGTMLDHVRQRPAATSYAVAAVLLADAAMALRNLVIALVFTVQTGVLLGAAVPLGAVVLGSLLVAGATADWTETVDIDLQSPFSLRRALGFGAVFLLIVLAGSLAEQLLGTAGFYATAVLSGLVSSAGATTSAVVLYRNGTLAAGPAVLGILLATGASILVKAALTATSPNRQFAYRVALWSVSLLVAATVATLAVAA
ncbi:MAG: MgtC/SapB family protein [Haloarculaceae archaeon]